MIIKSRTEGGSIGMRDWIEGPGCESANMGVSAKHPQFVYGGCYQGIVEELDATIGVTRAIMPWPALNLTEPTDKTRYRFNWTAPISFSSSRGPLYTVPQSSASTARRATGQAVFHTSSLCGTVQADATPSIRLFL